MMYLHWYCDNKAVPLAQRLHDGAARYTARFGQVPNVVQVSVDEPGDAGTAERLRALTKNNYRFGFEAPRLPGPDWPTLPLYANGKSCPAEIEDAGIVYEYVPGSLLGGRAAYRERA